MANDSTDLKKAMFQVSDAVIGAGILVFLGVFIGNWLDSKLNCAPWGVIGLSMLGAILGLARMVKKAMNIGVTSPDPRQRKNSSPSPADSPADSKTDTK